MKKMIFLRVFLLLFFSVAFVFAVGLWAVHQNSQALIAERLTVEAEMLTCMIRSENDIERLREYQPRHETRITVVREDGTVLYESSIAENPGNHADREEIIFALAGTPRAVERYSETFGCKLTYYAVSTTLENGEVIVLRVAVHSSEISSYFAAMIPFLLLVLVLSLAISGVLSNRLSNSLSEKVREVATSLRSLRDGKYEPIKTDSGEAEFYAVFCEINELNESTHSHIRTEEQEREKLNAVLDNVSQGIIALDPAENIAFANNSALEMFGGTRQDIGKQLIYLIEDSALCRKMGKRMNEGGSFEYSLGGRELVIAVRRISDETLSDVISSIIIVTDITKEKGIAKEKSDFFANASHELKTPITVMQGMAELILSKEELDDSSKKQVQRIHKESLRMAGLISDMLNLSSLERHEEEPTAVPVDLRAVADEVVSELASACTAKNITVEVLGEGKVRADAKKMYELIENLCSNAVNYNKENGSIHIDITPSKDRTVLTVSDTGIGIAKEHLPRLCERFYRVDKSRSKKTGGTGLGLAIVKHICALYNADLKIESELGIGTVVRISFPNE